MIAAAAVLAAFMAFTAYTWVRVDRLCDRYCDSRSQRVRRAIRLDVMAATGWWLVAAALLLLLLRGFIMGPMLLIAGVGTVGFAVARQQHVTRRRPVA